MKLNLFSIRINMDFNHDGDFPLGKLTLSEIERCREYIESKCMQGIKLELKQLDDEFYLKVPIYLACKVNPLDPMIRTHPSLLSEELYFIELTITDMICMSFDTTEKKWMSNQDIEGYDKNDELNWEKYIYEVLPISQVWYEREQQIQYTKSIILNFHNPVCDNLITIL